MTQTEINLKFFLVCWSADNETATTFDQCQWEAEVKWFDNLSNCFLFCMNLMILNWAIREWHQRWSPIFSDQATKIRRHALNIATFLNFKFAVHKSEFPLFINEISGVISNSFQQHSCYFSLLVNSFAENFERIFYENLHLRVLKSFFSFFSLSLSRIHHLMFIQLGWSTYTLYFIVRRKMIFKLRIFLYFHSNDANLRKVAGKFLCFKIKKSFCKPVTSIRKALHLEMFQWLFGNF